MTSTSSSTSVPLHTTPYPSGVDTLQHNDEFNRNIELQVPPPLGGCTKSAFENQVLREPCGILRLIEWLFTVIAFSCASDTDHIKQRGIDVAVEFLIFIGVVSWLWTMVNIGGYMWHIHQRYQSYMLTELIVDALLTVFLFCASVSVASRCNTRTRATRRCNGADRLPETAAAFGFLSFFCWLASTGLSYYRWHSHSKLADMRQL